MSIALWADIDAAKKRIEELEAELARQAAANLVLTHRIEQIEQWIAARKPGPKAKEA
ncbi:hypothetical protein [Paraburkholderia bannensis]|uniref:hypothetical protein n=1 Tax=Paraburkholderia bannensis TaxID=765414 RepID=UPI000A4397F1|nr:hypothetical protein [Paraburkholderia bannensis]